MLCQSIRLSLFAKHCSLIWISSGAIILKGLSQTVFTHYWLRRPRCSQIWLPIHWCWRLLKPIWVIAVYCRPFWLLTYSRVKLHNHGTMMISIFLCHGHGRPMGWVLFGQSMTPLKRMAPQILFLAVTCGVRVSTRRLCPVIFKLFPRQLLWTPTKILSRIQMQSR